MSTGDPSRVDVSDVCVFRRSVRPTAIERGRFQRPDRANKRVSVKPTDEVLQALMEKVAQAARESNAKAEAEKRRRLQTVADEIKEWKRKIAMYHRRQALQALHR